MFVCVYVYVCACTYTYLYTKSQTSTNKSRDNVLNTALPISKITLILGLLCFVLFFTMTSISRLIKLFPITVCHLLYASYTSSQPLPTVILFPNNNSMKGFHMPYINWANFLYCISENLSLMYFHLQGIRLIHY